MHFREPEAEGSWVSTVKSEAPKLCFLTRCLSVTSLLTMAQSICQWDLKLVSLRLLPSFWASWVLYLEIKRVVRVWAAEQAVGTAEGVLLVVNFCSPGGPSSIVVPTNGAS